MAAKTQTSQVRKSLKILAALTTGLVFLAAAAVIQAWYFKPLFIDVFFEKAFIKLVLDDPEVLSLLRLAEKAGLHFHNDELTDASPQHQLEQAAHVLDSLQTLRSYRSGPAKLDSRISDVLL